MNVHRFYALGWFLVLWIFFLSSFVNAFPSGLCRTAIVTSTPLLPGPVCANGGEMITITCFNTSVTYPACNFTQTNLNGTIDASEVTFYPAVPSQFTNASKIFVDVALNVLAARKAPVYYGGNLISVSNLNTSSFLISFTGALSSAGIGFSLVANGAGLSLNTLDAGAGIFISQFGNDLLIEADIAFLSSGSGDASIIDTSSPSSITFNELKSNIPLLTFASGGGVVSVSWPIICSDGRPSIFVNGSAVCGWQFSFGSPTTNCLTGPITLSWINGSKTWCEQQAPYTVTTAGSGVDPISSTSSSGTVLKSYTDTPSLSFSTTSTTISADVTITATDVTSGYASALAGCSGNNCNFRQFRATDPTLIDMQQDATTVFITSNLKAQNLPYPNVSLALFPDCPFATKVSDILVCLAGRTVGLLSNVTNAANVFYMPAEPFRGQNNFSVATGFDILFGNVQADITRIWDVDTKNGDDVLGDGSPVNPFKTIGHTFAAIGTFTWSTAQQVRVALGTYAESSLQWPPNTFLTAIDPLRIVQIVVNGTVTLRADWSTAGPHVEGGFSNVVLTATSVAIDFTIMGPPGPSSIAKFTMYNSEMIAPFVGIGRGGVPDFIQFLLMDMDQPTSINCASAHFERNIIDSSVTLTDTNCSSSLVNWHVLFNYFDGVSNFTASQSTTTKIMLDAFLNGWESGNVAVYAVTNGALVFNTFTVPLNLFIQSTVTVNYNLNMLGVMMCGLDITYWGVACLNGAQMMIILQGRGKLLTSSSTGGISLLYSGTITTNTLKEITSNSSFVPINTANGLIYISFVDPTTNIVSNTLTCVNHTGSVVCQPQIVNVSNANCDSGQGFSLFIGDGVAYPGCYPNVGNDTVYVSAGPNINVTAIGKNNYIIGLLDPVSNFVLNTLTCFNHSGAYICSPKIVNVSNPNCDSGQGYNIYLADGNNYPGCYPNLGNDTVYISSGSAAVNITSTAKNNYIVGWNDPTTNLVVNTLNCHNHSGIIVCSPAVVNVSNPNCDSGQGYNLYLADGNNYPGCYPNVGNDTVYISSGSTAINVTAVGKNNYIIGLIGSTSFIDNSGGSNANSVVRSVQFGGSDSDPGGFAQPYATLNKATTVIIGLGITPITNRGCIFIQGGTYTEPLNVPMNCEVRGTGQNMVRINGALTFQAAAAADNRFGVYGVTFLTANFIDLSASPQSKGVFDSCVFNTAINLTNTLNGITQFKFINCIFFGNFIITGGHSSVNLYESENINLSNLIINSVPTYNTNVGGYKYTCTGSVIITYNSGDAPINIDMRGFTIDGSITINAGGAVAGRVTLYLPTEYTGLIISAAAGVVVIVDGGNSATNLVCNNGLNSVNGFASPPPAIGYLPVATGTNNYAWQDATILKGVDIKLCEATADQTIANTVTATTMNSGCTGGGTGLSIAANRFTNGSSIQFKIRGVVSALVAVMADIQLKIGATVITNITGVALGTPLNTGFTIDGSIAIRSVGVSGKAIGEVSYTSGNAISSFSTTSTTATIDTTSVLTVDALWDFSMASLSNTITFTLFSVTAFIN